MGKVKWMTIIDGNTCNECLEMDGKVFEDGDIQPPLHGIDKNHKQGCRCYLVSGHLAEFEGKTE